MGAAIATVITEVAVFVLLYYFASKNGYTAEIIRQALKPIIAGVAMALAIVYLLSGLHLLLVIPLAAALYFAVLFILGGIGKEEFWLMRQFLRR